MTRTWSWKDSAAERLERAGWNVTESGCWEFLGFTSRKGYGQLRFRGKNVKAHRLAHEAWIGPVPDELVVMHSCDNPPCINPEHLSAGTVLDNTAKTAQRRAAVGFLVIR